MVLLRGPAASQWDLRPCERLAPEFDARVLVPRRNLYDTSALNIERVPVRTLGEMLPRGPAGRLATRALGERYLNLRAHLQSADIVHAAELGYWFSDQAARLKRELGYKLVLTVWETIPFRDAYRNVRTRRYRERVLAATDLFLACTERARHALELEGAPADRIEVCAPGIDVVRFAPSGSPQLDRDAPGTGHLVLSVGRLVWEKGHQDVLRAVALLRGQGRRDVRVQIVGVGPELRRLRTVAADLGLSDVVDFIGSVGNDEMPALYARASCLVLASLPTPYWEEQFGMVLAEALAARLPILAAAGGAIPEVLGEDGDLFAPGDWSGIAHKLAAGPLAQSPATRSFPSPERVQRFSTTAAAERLRLAYRTVLGA